MNTDKTQEALKPLTISAESIVGAGSGMLIAHVAQGLPEGETFKTWLVLLVPVLTLVIKHAWNFFEPEVVFALRNSRAHFAKRRYVKGADKMMREPWVTDELKSELEDMKVYVGLSSIMNLFRHWQSMAPKQSDRSHQ